MFRIKTWIPVEIDPKEDMLYITREDAEKEKAQLEEMQPENKYEIEETEEEGNEYYKIVFDEIENRYRVELIRIFEKSDDAFKYVRECNENLEERALEDCIDKLAKKGYTMEKKGGGNDDNKERD